MNNSLAYYITLLHKDFANYCNQQLHQLGLSQGLLFFILYIGNHPGCSPKQLALALRMDTGHVTRSLVKLEQGGFISQSYNEKDRRARVLHLQEKGTNALSASHKLFTDWDDMVLSTTENNTRATLLAQLDTLVRERKENYNV